MPLTEATVAVQRETAMATTAVAGRKEASRAITTVQAAVDPISSRAAVTRGFISVQVSCVDGPGAIQAPSGAHTVSTCQGSPERRVVTEVWTGLSSQKDPSSVPVSFKMQARIGAWWVTMTRSP